MTKRRFLAILLALTMIFQSMPVEVLADTVNGWMTTSAIVEGGTYHHVYFQDEDGTQIAYQYVEDGATLIVPEDLSKENHAFVGWFDTATGAQITEETLVTADIIAKAQYSPLEKINVRVDYRYSADGTTPCNDEAIISSVTASYIADSDKTETIEVPASVQVDGSLIGMADETVILYATRPDITVAPNAIAGMEGVKVETGADGNVYVFTVLYTSANMQYTIQYYAEAADSTAENLKFDTTPFFTETRQGVAGNHIYFSEPDPTVYSSNATAAGVFEHSVFDHATDIILVKDGTGDANVLQAYYRLQELKLHYDSQGGSYVEPKSVKYGKSVDVYSGEPGKTCNIEEHTHTNKPRNDASFKNAGTVNGCYTSTRHGSGRNASYSWDLTCGKEEHTHSAACQYDGTIAPAPTRTGYTFQGWYTTPDGDVAAEERIESMTADTTVYAHWQANTANYTIVYLEEIWDNSTNSSYYAYHSSVKDSGVVGTTVTASFDGVTLPANYEAGDTTSAIVKADGSTVVIARFKLIRYTLIFDLDDQAGGWWNDAVTGTITMNGHEYHGNEYRITAVLGQDVSAQWPTVDNTKRSNGEVLDTWNSDYKTKRFEVTSDMLSGANGSHEVTYTAHWMNSGTQKTVEYWLQDAEGNGYKKSETYSQTFQDNNGLGAKNIFGFTPHNGTPTGYQGNVMNRGTVTTYRFYYDRSLYTITYFNKDKQLTEKTNIRFGANINNNTYNYTPTEEIPEGYTFGGWYDNAECNGDPYPFGTMPGNNLVLYAKFIPPQHKVHVDTQDENDGTNKDITVEHGKTVGELEIPTREGYDFAGWYKDADCTQAFDPDEPIMGDTTIYAKWTRQNLNLTIKYVAQDEAGNWTVEVARTVNETLNSQLFAADPDHPQVTRTAPYVDGYRIEGESTKTIELHYGSTTTVEFHYVKRDATSYTVRYVIYETDDLISLSEVPGGANPKEQDVDAHKDTVTEIAPKIDGYYLVGEGIKSITINGDETQNVITFEYLPRKTVDVTVKHVLRDAEGEQLGNILTDAESFADRVVGDSVTVEKKPQGDEDGSGFTFKEYGNDNNDNYYVAVASDAGREDGITLTAYYEIAQWYVKFHYEGDVPASVPAADTFDKTLDYPAPLFNYKGAPEYKTSEKPEDTTKYYFDGWYLDEDCTQWADTVTVPEWHLSGNNRTVNVYGRWLPKTIDVQVIKTWAGLNEGDPKPNSVHVTLTGSGGKTYEQELKVPSWFYTFTGLPKVDSEGNDITYTISETSIDGYTTTYDQTTVTGENGSITITNTYTGGKAADITGTKVWKEVGGQIKEHNNKEEVPLILSRSVDGITFEEVPEGEYNLEWKDNNFTFSGLKQYNTAGQPYTYSVKEEVGEGNIIKVGDVEYKMSQTDNTITNTDQTPSLTVTKTADKTEGLVIGDTVTYTITVKNNGNVPVNNIAVVDEKTGMNETIDTLASGASETFTTTYTVTAADVKDMKIENTVTATGTDASGNTATDTATETVNTAKKPIAITIKGETKTKTYDGQKYTVDTYTVTGIPETNNDITVELKEGASITVSQKDAGTYTQEITADKFTVSSDAYNVTVKYENGSLTINKRKVTLTSATDSKQYDGTALKNETVTVGGDGFVEGEGATYDVTGSQLLVGDSKNNFTYTLNENTKADNYEITTELGTLTVTDRTEKYAITVKANSDTVTYDGQNHSVSGFESLTFEVNGLTYTVSGLEASASGTDAGTYDSKVTGTAVVKDAAGNDVTDQFTVTTEDGKLTINKRAATVKSASAEKEYDGTALTAPEVTGEGFVEGEGVTGTATGSQLTVGSSENPFTYEANEGTNLDNYTITETKGTLAVKDRTEKYEITVKANSDTVTYDGQKHTVEGFESLTFEVNGLTYTVSGLEASASGTNAGEYPSTVTGKAVVKDAAGNDVTAQFDVKTVDGTLTIKKTGLTVTKGADKTEGVKLGDTISYTITVTNSGEVTVNDITVNDSLTGESWTIASLAAGVEQKFTTTHTVSDADIIAGKIENTATATGTPEDLNTKDAFVEMLPVTGEDSVTVTTVEAKADYVVHKNISSIKRASDGTIEGPGSEPTVHLNDEIKYHVWVQNTGTVTLHDIHVEDELTGDEWTIDQLAPGAFWPADEEGNAGTWETKPYLVTEQDILKPFETGSKHEVTNVAKATAQDPNGNTIEKEGFVSADVDKADAKLAMTKTANFDRPVQLGETITYTFTVTNTGNVTVSGITVSDALTGNVGDQALQLEPSTLKPGETGKATATYKVTEADILKGSIENNATATGTAPDESEVTAQASKTMTTVKAAPELIVTKTVANSPANNSYYVLGETITYTIEVRNDGNVTVNNITVADTKADEAADDGVIGYIGSLEPGKGETFTVSHTVTEKDILDTTDVLFVNTATATGTGANGSTVEDEAEEKVAIDDPHPMLKVEKTVLNSNAGYDLGDKVIFHITVTNVGNVTVNGITLKDELTSSIFGTMTTDEENNAVFASETLEAQTLAPGASFGTYTQYTVTEGDIWNRNINNTATANGTGANDEPVTASDDASAMTKAPAPALDVEKTAVSPKGVAHLGDTITYTITVTNTGNVTVNGVLVTDEKTNMAKFAHMPGFAGDDVESAPLAPGETATLTTTYTVTEDDIRKGEIVNTAVATANSHGVSAEDTETVTDEPDPDNPDKPVLDKPNGSLLVEKKVVGSNYGFKLGDKVRFTIHVTNNGNVTLIDIHVSDPLTGQTDNPEWTIKALAPGESASFVTDEYTVTEADILTGRIVNIATAVGTDRDGNEVSGRGEVTATTAAQTPELTVVKTADKTSGWDLGEKVTYKITVTNTGNVTVKDIEVVDPATGYRISITSMAPGKSYDLTTTHKITEEDILAGKFVNTATATGTDPNGEEVSASDDETVTTVEPNPALTSKKELMNKGTGKYGAFKAGETAEFDITVTNSGNVTQENVTVTEGLTGAKIVEGEGYTINEQGKAVIESLAPGKSVTVKATYTVTQADIDNKNDLKNIAYVDGSGDTPDPDPEPIPEEEQNAKLMVSKRVVGSTYGWKVGDTVWFRVIVKNTGNVTLNLSYVGDELLKYQLTPRVNLAPGEEWQTDLLPYTVTDADVISGSIINTANASATDPNGKTVTGEGSITVTTVKANSHLTVTKTTTSTPENGAAYALGETITYNVTVTNDGSLTVKDIAVTDELTGATWTIDSLAPGETYPDKETDEPFTTSHTVTEADILAGNVVNVATATGTDAAGDEVTASGQVKDPTEEPAPSLEVKKVASKTSGAELGEAITYTVTVINNGNVTLHDVEVYDAKTGMSDTVASLAPDASKDFTTTYTVTEADILNGSIENTATANGYDPNGTMVYDSGNATVNTAAAAPALEVTKRVTSSKEDYNLGDTVTYHIIVENTGNLTVNDIELLDELTGSRFLQLIPGGFLPTTPTKTLAPGESFDVFTQYVVTEADINAGSIGNTAKASGTASNNDEVNGEDSIIVTTAKPNPAKQVEKKLTNKGTGENGAFKAGETATFDITVKNTGNVTLDTVNVAEALANATLTEEYTVSPEGAATVVINGTAAIISNLLPGATVTLHAEYTVTQDDIDNQTKLQNTVTVIGDGTTTGPDPEPIPTEEEAPALTVVKEADKTSDLELGDVVTYTITVTNSGNVTLTLTEVKDTQTRMYDWSGGNVLAPGETATYTTTHTITEADILNGSFTNIAEATGKAVSGKTAYASGDETVTTVAQNPKLKVTKTVAGGKNDGFALGETVTFHIVVENIGNLTVSGINVKDLLEGQPDYNVYTFVVGDLAPGEKSAVLTYTMEVMPQDIAAGRIVNNATASGIDPNGKEVTAKGSALAIPVDVDAHLTVNKTITSTPANGEAYMPGEVIEYSVTVTNDGNVYVTNIWVTDELTGNEWDVPRSLAPGETSEARTVYYTVTEADILTGSVLNVATATGEGPNGEDVTVEPGEAETKFAANGHLTVTKTAVSYPVNGTAYELGEIINYAISVKNDGNLTITDVVVTDPLTGDEWEVGTLVPGQVSQRYETSYTVTEDDILAGSVLNVATATGTSPDPKAPEVPVTPGEDKQPTQTPNPSLYVDKMVMGGPGNNVNYVLGEKVTYTIHVANNGNVTVTDIDVVDPETGYRIHIDYLAPGAYYNLTTDHRITEADILKGSFTNTATATGKGPNGETVTDSDSVTVITEPVNRELSATKTLMGNGSGENGAFKAGDTAEFDITVTNTGNITQTNVTVTEQLAGAKIVEGEGYTVEDGKAVIGSMTPGATMTVKAEYTVTQTDIDRQDKLTNIVLVQSDDSSDHAYADIPIEPAQPELTVTKTANKTTGAALGDVITYTITVKNTGNVTVNNVVVTDDLTGMNLPIGTLAPEDEITLHTSYTVTEADIQNLNIMNIAAANGTDPKGETVTGSDEEIVVTEAPNKELTAAKRVTSIGSGEAGAFKAGETAEFDIIVTNSGNLTQTNVTVTEQLAGAAIIEGAGYTINEKGQAVIETLVPGATVAVKATYTVTQSDIDRQDEITNMALVKGEGWSDHVYANIPIEPAQPELTVTKTADNGSQVSLGGVITYSITVKNTGNVTVNNVVVTDNLTGMKLNIGTLALEQEITLHTSYTVTEADILAGRIENTATATGTDPNGGAVTDSDTETVTNEPNPDEPDKPVIDEKDGHLTITKTTTSTPANGETYALGETITYSITAENDGNLTITDITVTDELTGDTWAIASLEPGASKTFTASHVVTEADILAGKVVNEATAKGTSPDPDEPDVPVDPGKTEDPTDPKNGHLTITKETTSTPAPDEKGNEKSTYALGETITYSITAENDGNLTITDITVTDELTGDTWTIESLAPNEKQTFTAEYVVTEADILAGKVVNEATATGTSPDPDEPDVPVDPGKTEDPTDPKNGHLTITKETTSTPAPDEKGNEKSTYALGETITYSITAENDGNLTLTDITVTDELTGDSWTIESLAPNEKQTFTAEYVVTEADILAGSVVNVATAKGTSPDPDEPEVPVDPGDTEDPTDPKGGHLTITKETTSTPANGETYALGETITYEIVAENDGNLTITDITVTDELTGDSWTIESLEPGKSETFTAEYEVTEDDILAGSVLNVATAKGTSPDPDEPDVPVDPGDTEDPTDPKGGHLTITKTTTSEPENGETYALGETITYSITAENDGNLTITDITVTDELTGDSWTIESLAPNEKQTFTASHVVTEADILAGSVVNVATAKGTSPDPDEPDVPVDPGDTEDPTDPKDGHLTITKTTTSEPENGETYALGETITYEIVAENDGNLTITDITVTDELTGDEWTIESLEPGASETFTAEYEVTEDDILAGSVLNVATAKGTSPDPDEPDVPVDPGDTEDPTDPKGGHLTITKTTTSEPENGETYALGEKITYEIVAENDGNLTITDITVTDELTGDEWTIESLEPGASETFTAEYEVTEDDILAGSVLNVATAKGTSPDPDEPDVPVDPGDTEDPTDPKDGHLTITKTTTSEPENGETYALGETITYSITAENDGNLTLTDITVTDELTGDSWTIESLAPGKSEIFTAEYAVTEADILAGSVVNVATATGTSPDPDEPEVPTDPGDTEDPTDPKDGHLTITKETTSTPANGETYALGETITYSITATNDGNLTLTDVTVTDELTGDEWTIESLEPGVSETFTAEYEVTEDDILAGSVLNVATATGTSPDPDEPDVPVDPGEEEVPTDPKEGHLTITKTTTSEPENGETYALGETITYEIVAENDGNLTLTDITVTDELTGDSWTIESLAPGKSETFTTSHVVTEADILAGSVVNVATATGTSPDPDEPEVPVDPGDTEDPTNPKGGHLTITKTTTSTPANGTAYALGETIAYSITATNDGNLTLTDITVTDALTGDTWTIATLAPNASETFTASYVVTEADLLAGSVLNVATATGTSPDPDEPEVPVDPGEKEDPTQQPNASLFVQKTSDKTGTVVLGEIITYTITVLNNGNLTVSDIIVTDPLTGLEQNVGTLTPGRRASVTTTHTVTEEDILAGSVANIATATGADPTGEDVTDDDTETVTTVPKNGHLTITKAATSAPANGTAYGLGETITYSITATNDGNLTLTDVTVTDELTGDAWTIASLAPGASETFTASHVVTEADILAGSVVNVATAEGTSPDPDEPDVPVDPGEEEVPTDPKEGHLTITKTTTSAPANGTAYGLGETITYSITATNDGNLTLTDITVTDALTGDTWTIASLAPNASETFTTSHVVTEADILAGSVLNVATAEGTSPDPDEPDVPVDPGEEEVPTDPKDGHLTITKTTTSTPANGTAYGLGETITYSITATNDGNLTLTDITVTDALTGDIWTIATLAPNASETFTASYVVTEADLLAGSVVNVATAEGTSPDPDEPDVPVDPGEREDPTQNPNPSLFVQKTSDKTGTVTLGETITYTINVTNNGNMTVTDITVTDPLTGDSWTIESLEPGDSETFTATYVVTEADILAGEIVNTATATGTDPDDDPVTDDDTETVTTDPKNGHLTIIKAATSVPANGTAYVLGETITYSITATNDGNLTITDITVTDELTGDAWTIESLAPGASQTFTTSHVVTEADILAGSVVNVATAEGTSPDPDEPDVPVDPGEEEVPTEQQNGHLTITKTTTSVPANGTAYALGETITYEITATNDGNLTLTDITVTDELTGDAWTIESLAPGATSEAFTAEYVVTEADILAGSVLNVATATAISPDPDEPEAPVTPGENEVPTEEVNASYTVAKTVTNLPAAGLYNEGETVTYNIHVENTGNVTVYDLVITEGMTGAVIAEGAGYTVAGNLITIEALEPGQTLDVAVSYTVTNDDLGAPLTNIVTATADGPDAENPDENKPDDQTSNATVPTAERTYTLTVHYRYLDGTEALADYVQDGLLAGAEYYVESPDLANFTVNPDFVEGVMPPMNWEVTVFYVPIAPPPVGPTTVIIDEYGVPLNIGNVVMNVGDCFE